MRGWEKNCMRDKNENLKEREHLLDQWLNGIRVKWILKQQCRGVWS
jgi:hypothetical protein